MARKKKNQAEWAEGRDAGGWESPEDQPEADELFLLDEHDDDEDDAVQYKSSQPLLEEDSTKTYLREIGRHKLLTGREEIELARAAKLGDERARQRLIQSNLRLVVSIARASSI